MGRVPSRSGDPLLPHTETDLAATVNLSSCPELCSRPALLVLLILCASLSVFARARRVQPRARMVVQSHGPDGCLRHAVIYQPDQRVFVSFWTLFDAFLRLVHLASHKLHTGNRLHTVNGCDGE